MMIDDPLYAIHCASQANLARHADAVAWLHDDTKSLKLVWLASDQVTLDVSERSPFVPERLRRRISAAQRQSADIITRRIARAVTERLAMQVAMQELFSTTDDGPRTTDHGPPIPDSPTHASRLTPRIFALSHTHLGQPIARWRDATWARERGLQARSLHISFSHDGDAHLALAAYAPGLRGVGVDIVHLRRLRGEGKDRDYLHRFARRFMSEEEYRFFAAESRGEDDESLVRRVAAHFSLMEAASKALGTGLKMGGGMGQPDSLPKQALNIAALGPAVAFSLGTEARDRCAALGAMRLEGHWSADAEFLVSAALLWE